MTIDEIIKIASDRVKHLDRFSKDTGLVRPTNLASPMASAFVAEFLTLCKANNIEFTAQEQLDTFMSSKLTNQAIDEFFAKGNFQRRTPEQKADLMKFAGKMAPIDSKILGECTERGLSNEGSYSEIGFSKRDEAFIYGASVVRDVVEESRKKAAGESGQIEIALDEAQQKDIALKMLRNQEQEAREKNRPLVKNCLEEEKNRDIAIVIGAPGSGKSTYINELKNKGYVSIDLDDIAVEIASRLNVQVIDHEKAIYNLAGRIADIQAEESLRTGYNICVEKIGHSSSEIKGVAKHFAEIAEKQGLNTKNSLLCAHVAKETSVVRASQRTIEQIMGGKDLRYYKEEVIYGKDNAPLYTYLEILKDELQGSEPNIFESMRAVVCESGKQELSELELNESSRKRFRDMTRAEEMNEKLQGQGLNQSNLKDVNLVSGNNQMGQ